MRLDIIQVKLNDENGSGGEAELSGGIAILRLVGQAIKSTHERNNTAEDSSLSLSSSSLLSLLSVMRKGLWKILQSSTTNNNNNERTDDTQEWIVHRGSCHCHAIQFEVRENENSFHTWMWIDLITCLLDCLIAIFCYIIVL